MRRKNSEEACQRGFRHNGFRHNITKAPEPFLQRKDCRPGKHPINLCLQLVPGRMRCHKLAGDIKRAYDLPPSDKPWKLGHSKQLKLMPDFQTAPPLAGLGQRSRPYLSHTFCLVRGSQLTTSTCARGSSVLLTAGSGPDNLPALHASSLDPAALPALTVGKGCPTTSHCTVAMLGSTSVLAERDRNKRA